MKVLVAHSGLQHSHQLALALYEAGHLLAFWSGVPLADAAHSSRGWGRFSSRLRRISIPARQRFHPAVFPALRRISSRVLSSTYANSINHRLDHLFDHWVARHVAKLKPDMVICYENSAARTFGAAKSIGAICVLDAASVHFVTSAKLLGAAGHDPSWINRQKEREINLADAILVCSSFAAESYAAAGVAESKVKLCELGIDVPPSLPQSQKLSADKCRFIFVGSLSSRKGVDVLLDVFERLQRDGAPAMLTLVGGTAEHDLAARARSLPGVRHLPFVEKPALYDVMAEHDCLVLPSRLDSFGLVVPEAMAMGLPAIVSDRAGAKSIIDRHPDSGWIVPFDATALEDRIRHVIANRQMLVVASRAAIKAVQDFSGTSYRTRVVSVLRDIYTSHDPLRDHPEGAQRTT